jgi:hypothetical protein
MFIQDRRRRAELRSEKSYGGADVMHACHPAYII